jgi:hypothetical protein
MNLETSFIPGAMSFDKIKVHDVCNRYKDAKLKVFIILLLVAM